MSSSAPSAPVALRVLSNPAYLCVVRAAAERFCLLAGFDGPTAQSVGLALDEALTNVIRHGYSGRPNQPIHVELCIRPATDAMASPLTDELFIRVRDYGQQVDAARIIPRALEDIRPGGLGVHIMRSVMDRVDYRKRGVAGMELVMTKRIPVGAAPGQTPAPTELPVSEP